MGLNKITRRFAAWIACCAILFAALAPSVSQATAATRGDVWTEICSLAGIKLVKVAADQSAGADPAANDMLHLEHCPFCATHGGAVALLPGAELVVPLLDPEVGHPALFFQAPRPLPIWTTAQSRAPPAQS